jgi:hypothetical protein
MTGTDPTVEIPVPHTHRPWSRHKKGMVAVLLTTIVMVCVAIAVAAPEVSRSNRLHADATREQADQTGPTPGGLAPAGSPWANDDSTSPASGAPGEPLPGGPVLVVETDIYAEPGENGALFFISNAGGSPLEWSWVPDDSPVAVVQPAFGTVAPGGSQLVSFELPTQGIDFVYPLSFESNGGAADVRVHLSTLDPVFEIVDGTWNIRNGNTFLVSYGDLDVGLTVKNVGDEPLYVEPQLVDGLAVIGGPWTLQPGEEVHLHIVLCNASYSGGIPDFHDRDFHIHTDSWQETLTFGVRFTLEPGDAALPC